MNKTAKQRMREGGREGGFVTQEKHPKVANFRDPDFARAAVKKRWAKYYEKKALENESK